MSLQPIKQNLNETGNKMKSIQFSLQNIKYIFQYGCHFMQHPFLTLPSTFSFYLIHEESFIYIWFHCTQASAFFKKKKKNWIRKKKILTFQHLSILGRTSNQMTHELSCMEKVKQGGNFWLLTICAFCWLQPKFIMLWCKILTTAQFSCTKSYCFIYNRSSTHE